MYNLSIVFSLLVSINVVFAQDNMNVSLDIGDTAPPLSISKWIKGTPIERFESNKVYVIEFWATWCKPCIASMPKMSDLNRKYKNQVNFVGIHLSENKINFNNRIERFVDSIGKKIKFDIAIDNNEYMYKHWMKASRELAIPVVFVIGKQGDIEWIGHPNGLKKVLSKIMGGNWNRDLAKENRNIQMQLNFLDSRINERLREFRGTVYTSFNYGSPDSTLYYINEVVSNEPRVRFFPYIAKHTFAALLRTDIDSAISYGKIAIQKDNYLEIIDGIQNYYDPMNIPKEIYKLGVNALKEMIKSHSIYATTPKNLLLMAEWYWKAGDRADAIRCQRKAIKLMKREMKNVFVDVY